MLTEAIGYAAALCSMVSFAPQAWKIIWTRDASAVSAGMYAINATGFALWTAYGVLLGQWPLILTNSVCFTAASFILVMKSLPGARRSVAKTLSREDGAG